MILNYMKSEWYRVVRSKGIYLFTFGIAAFMLAGNLLLALMNIVEPDFPYGTVRFSLSNMVVFIYLVVLCAGLVAVLLFSDDRKNGTLKNALASGLTRTQLFIAKCIMGCVFGLISLVVILGVYIGSAVLLLQGPAAEAVGVLIQGVLAILPSAAAAVVFAVVSFHVIANTNWALIFWVAILFVVPILFHTLGLYYEPVALIARWLPTNVFLFEAGATMSGFDCIWQTGAGMAMCLAIGVIYIVLFAAIGIRRTNKLEF